MDVKTYRAATMHEALALVRADLGPEAAVLHTREVRRRRLFGLVGGASQIEVTASAEVLVPSRLPPRLSGGLSLESPPAGLRVAAAPPAPADDRVQTQISELQAMVQQLCRRTPPAGRGDLPEALFRLYTDLIEAEFDEDLARRLVEQVRGSGGQGELTDTVMAKARLARLLEAEIAVAGPLRARPGGRRVVALVGPTGVGKTTTIAKLAAEYRLRQRRQVGLITVDTYRIAAVEQLRTYADIIDLPMQVVSTPREMREAVARMREMELVLVDTAGRSPRDEVKIRELRTVLAEAAADEVHLVLSSVAGARTLEQTAERFAAAGTTALILTKLDEAVGVGNLLPLLRAARLPLSYLTNGQNVPDDIEVADPRRLTRLMLGIRDQD